MKLIGCLVALLSLAACVTQKNLTRDEWLAISSHTYPAGREQVIAAAEKVLKLADGDDFVIVHNADGFEANRRWSVFLLIAAAFGTDYWNISTAPTPDGGTKVSLRVATSASSTSFAPTVGGDISAYGGPTLGGSVNGNAVYLLFWNRLDYLLGAGDAWKTCEQFEESISRNGPIWGTDDPLCLVSDDRLPDGSPGRTIGRQHRVSSHP